MTYIKTWLTLTKLLHVPNPADEKLNKLVKFFLFFSETGFDISCSLDTI